MAEKKNKPVKHNKHLSPKQRAFVHNYIDPDSDTYSNGTQSYKKVYNSHSDNGAAASATQLLNKPKIQSYIEEIMEQKNIGIQDRIAALAEITKGGQKETVIESVNPETGKVKSKTVIKSQIANSDRLKAIDIANKMDGTYSKADSLNKIAEKEFEGFRKHLFRNVTPSTNKADKVDCSPSDVQSEGDLKGVSDVDESIE